MIKSVAFFYDYGSPTAYLAWTQLPAICARHHATLVYKPMLLGAVMKATGNQSPRTIRAKSAWMGDDMARYSKRYQVPFKRNPVMIQNTIGLMRGAIWAQQANCFDAYHQAIFNAAWVDEVDMNQPEALSQVLTGAGLDAEAMTIAIGTNDVKQALIANTNEAVDLGVFGAPTMFVGEEMHFGQDRLEWVEQALR